MKLEAFLKKITSAGNDHPGPVVTKKGVTDAQIDKWESRHKGLVIPKQYRAFLRQCNGLTIRPSPGYSTVGAFTFYGLDNLEEGQAALRGAELYGEEETPEDAMILGEADNGEVYIIAEGKREKYLAIGAEREFQLLKGGCEGALAHVSRTYLAPLQNDTHLIHFSPATKEFYKDIRVPASIGAIAQVGPHLVTAAHEAPWSDDLVVWASLREVARWPSEDRQPVAMVAMKNSAVLMLEGRDELQVLALPVPKKIGLCDPKQTPTVLLQIKEKRPEGTRRELVAMGKEVYFVVYKRKGAELWATDCTPTGTRMLKAFQNIAPTHLMVRGEFLAFYASER